MRALDIEQTPLLLDEFLPLRLPRPIESTVLNELNDPMELSAIQEGAVAPAYVDNRTGEASEVDPIHHFSAARTPPVAYALGPRGDRVPVRRRCVEDGRPALAIRT